MHFSAGYFHSILLFSNLTASKQFITGKHVPESRLKFIEFNSEARHSKYHKCRSFVRQCSALESKPRSINSVWASASGIHITADRTWWNWSHCQGSHCTKHRRREWMACECETHIEKRELHDKITNAVQSIQLMCENWMISEEIKKKKMPKDWTMVATDCAIEFQMTNGHFFLFVLWEAEIGRKNSRIDSFHCLWNSSNTFAVKAIHRRPLKKLYDLRSIKWCVIKIQNTHKVGIEQSF